MTIETSAQALFHDFKGEWENCPIEYLQSATLMGALSELGATCFGVMQADKTSDGGFTYSRYYPPKVYALEVNGARGWFLKTGDEVIPIQNFVRALDTKASALFSMIETEYDGVKTQKMIGNWLFKMDGEREIIKIALSGEPDDCTETMTRINNFEEPTDEDMILFAPRAGAKYIKLKDLELGVYEVISCRYRAADGDKIKYDSIDFELKDVEGYVSGNSKLVKTFKQRPVLVDMVNNNQIKAKIDLVGKKPYGQSIACDVALIFEKP